MFTNIKQRIPFLKNKTLDEYTNSILMPSFNMMEAHQNASILGIDVSTYNQVILSSKNVNSLENNHRIIKLINYIDKMVFDKEFVQKAIKKMIFVVNYGKYNCTNNSFAGSIDIKELKYKVALEISENKITFASDYNGTKLRGSFSSSKYGIKIKYNEKHQVITRYSKNTLFNIDNKTNLEIYDQSFNQIFGYQKIKQYNYYEDNETKEKIIKEIDPNQNYTFDEYKWRCPNNTIIKKKELNYRYPKGISSDIKDINEFLIGRNISPNNNKLPNKGNYYELNQELFLDYCSNRCDISTLWEHVS